MPERRAYLLDVTDRCPNERLMQELVDILARYSYNEFFVFSSRDRNVASPLGMEGDLVSRDRNVASPLGMEGDLVTRDRNVASPLRCDGRGDATFLSRKVCAYCEIQGVDFAEIGPDEYDALLLDGKTVCAPTFAARSLCGRIEEMRHAMEQGEVTVRARKAKRFLVTDFSDGRMWHPLCVSLPAIILGGSMMTGGAKAAMTDLEKELCSVMELPVAGLLQKLGTLYLRGGALRADASEFFNILAGDCGYSRHPGLTQPILDEVSAICRGIRIQLERWTDRSDWAKEIAYAASLLDCACHRRSEPMLRALRDEHGRLWRLRNTPEGRVESLSKLPRF